MEAIIAKFFQDGKFIGRTDEIVVMTPPPDAAVVTYTPTTLADWGGSDPGNTDDALDYLAANAGGLTFGSPVDIGTANADGSGTNVPHANHVHNHPSIASGNLHPEYASGGGSAANGYGTPKGTLSRSYTFASTVESWTTDTGTLSSTGSKLRLVKSGAGNASALEPSGAGDVADGELVVNVYYVSGVDVGIIFRAADASNHYMLTVRTTGSGNSIKFELFKKVSGSYTSLSGITNPDFIILAGATFFRVLVRFYGDQIELYVNETMNNWWRDTTYTTGIIGVRCDNTTADFDDVKVYTLSSDPLKL